jgi:class 3 adenylate cyclase
MVGPVTAEHIQDSFVLADTGHHELKNVSEPLRVFRLIPPGSLYTRLDQKP